MFGLSELLYLKIMNTVELSVLDQSEAAEVIQKRPADVEKSVVLGMYNHAPEYDDRILMAR